MLASTLLGTVPPRMPADRLVRVGVLFGLADGTVRTALSRMVAAGELRRDDRGRYELAGDLLRRQRRQLDSRSAGTTEPGGRPGDWSGRWVQAVVVEGARGATDRAALRRAMARLRLAELRDGVWLRPDNLDPARDPEERRVVDAQCRWFGVEPGHDDELAATLWDLAGWSDAAMQLRRAMAGMVGRLDDGDVTALADGFVLSAQVLRHLVADPLLPPELLGRRWAGGPLRSDYDRFDAAFRATLRGWLDDDPRYGGRP
ncbi:MAG: PaaX domain-containing protein, C- domain protein [Microthrixaceae bacterium]